MIVIALWASLTALIISGCVGKEPTIKFVVVPQKCSVPNINPPIVSNVDCGMDYKCIAVKATNNYALMRTYAEELNAALDVCR